MTAGVVGRGLLAFAQPAEEPGKGIQELRNLLATQVVVATKVQVPLLEAPAIVTVIRRDELVSSGARSVGEALQGVPGLYGIDDRLAINFGVRGINGGLRSYGRILKVLLDGQPVAFRSDGANYLGPELVAIEAVERIEVVRGPASALYGADAFLGVVNIVTRMAMNAGDRFLLARVGREREGYNASGEAFLAMGEEPLGVAFSASLARLDRSGAEVPEGSPILRLQSLSADQSKEDVARPGSAYLRAWWAPAPKWRLELNARQGRLDAHAEWLDFGTLSKFNRVVLNQSFGRLKAEWTPQANFDLSASLAWSKGEPGGSERLDLGSPATYPRRDFGFRTWEGALEGRLQAFGPGSLVLGVDGSSDRERLIQVFTVDAVTGAAQPNGLSQGEQGFRNHGYYVQYSFRPVEAVGLTANWRRDVHSAYGSNTSYRLGAVWNLTDRFGFKALYGTAFKAPAALQLYAQPLYPGELVGNPTLKPETARTLEAEMHWRALDGLLLSLNGFRNRIADKVELVAYSTGLRPENRASQESSGFEGEGHLYLGAHTLKGSLAYQRTDDVRPDPFLGEQRTPSELYPGLVSQLRWRFRSESWGTCEVNGRYVSSRRASGSNILFNHLQPYDLPPYARFDATWTLHRGSHRFQARVANLLDRRYADPGFRGFDVPGPRREWILAYGRSF